MKKHNKQVFQTKKLNTTAGITLIALVITIIVLLILAGVTISVLLGENGVIEQAQNAKVVHEKASAEEEIKMEVGASHGTDGNIDIAKLNANLSNLGIDANIESLPSENIEYKGKKFIIKRDGTISIFDSVEWDKTAADEDCFVWKSNEKGTEGYGTIIGYTEKINNYTKLRYPSRCTKIEFSDSLDSVLNNGTSRVRTATARSRAYTNNILKVEIPQTVTYIGAFAFGDHSNTCFQSMETINIPDSVTYIGEYAFERAINLSSIKLPEGITIINIGTFVSCTSLTNIILPDSITEIHESAFRDCINLVSITLPDSIQKIGDQTFLNTAWLNNSSEGPVYIGKVLYTYKGIMPEETEITIKEGTKVIANNAFKNCNNLTNIVIPKSVTNIGSYAFLGCSNLSNVVIPKSVTNIGSYAFSGCNNVSNIIIPNSVKIIENYAFDSWEANQTINCIAKSKPNGWEEQWDYYDWPDSPRKAQLVWGYTGE